MAANVNVVILAGNLTRDPEVKFLANENAVCSFGIAMNERWKDKNGEPKEKAVFVDVSAFGKTAELVGQYLTKGSACLIQGKLDLDSWEDKATGAKRSKLRVVADSVQFLGSKPDGQARGSGQIAGQRAPSNPHAPTKEEMDQLDDQTPF